MGELRVIVGGRGSGKTERLVDWLAAGEKIAAFPGWSRVAVVVNQLQADYLARRLWERDEPRAAAAGIFTAADTLALRGAARGLEVAFDNVDMVLSRMMGEVATVSLVTISGEVEALGG